MKSGQAKGTQCSDHFYCYVEISRDQECPRDVSGLACLTACHCLSLLGTACQTERNFPCSASVSFIAGPDDSFAGGGGWKFCQGFLEVLDSGRAQYVQ